MDKARLKGAGIGDIGVAKDGERLQKRRPLRPEPALEDIPAVVIASECGFPGCGPARHVVACQNTLPARAFAVHDGSFAEVVVNRLGHEAGIEGPARCFDLGLAPLCRLGLVQKAGPEGGKLGVAEQGAAFWYISARKPDRCGGWPFGAEELGVIGDDVGGAWQDRIARAGIVYRGFKDGAKGHRAIVAQHQHPGVECAGNDRGQKARAGDHAQPLGLVVFHGGTCRGGALTADHRGCLLPCRPDKGGHVAQGAVQLRLDHVQHESRWRRRHRRHCHPLRGSSSQRHWPASGSR